LAENLVKQSKFADALAVLDEGSARGPEPPALLAVRGQALRGVGRRAGAIALADRALAAHPDGVFYLLRGQLYLDDGNAAAAVPLLEQAARLYRKPYQAYFLLAQAYAATARKADAERANRRADEIRQDLQRATDLSREAMDHPLDPSVRIRLAEVFDRLQEPDLATMWRKAAAELQARQR
jgi:predicted Zn-dependent protease